MPISSRNCRLMHENYGLNFVNYYSKTACEFECAVNRSISICQCLPWFYTNNFTEVPVCDMFGGYCFEKIMSDEKQYRMCPDFCLEDCSETHLTWEESFRPIAIDVLCKKESYLYILFDQTTKQHLDGYQFIENPTEGNE